MTPVSHRRLSVHEWKKVSCRAVLQFLFYSVSRGFRDARYLFAYFSLSLLHKGNLLEHIFLQIPGRYCRPYRRVLYYLKCLILEFCIHGPKGMDICKWDTFTTEDLIEFVHQMGRRREIR